MLCYVMLFLLAATSKHVQVRLDCTSRKKILRQQRREKYDYSVALGELRVKAVGALGLTAQDLASGD